MFQTLQLHDLAIFTGIPTFSEKLHVGRPNIGDRECFMAMIADMLDRRWLTNNGPFAREFERQMADLLGVRHFLAINNGTIALEIAIKALGLKGEVIVPSMTFIATPHALQWLGIKPVFCDVVPGTYHLDPACVEKHITPRTSGILGVHLWGQPCDIEGLQAVADRYNLKLLFDAAHAFGCSYDGRMIGNFGDAEVFSFHATKFFNSLEGGAVATNDDGVASLVRSMRNFGFVENDFVAYEGTNGKMNEASAAMGLASLAGVESFMDTNYRHYQQYHQELADVPGVSVITYDEAEQNNFQYVILNVNEQAAGISRDELVEILVAENVLARRYFYPGCHRMEPYRSDPTTNRHLPETARVVEETMGVPTGTVVGPGHIQTICAIIRTAVTHAAEIRAYKAQRLMATLS